MVLYFRKIYGKIRENYERSEQRMDFNRILEKKIKYEQNKDKISSVTLASYEKDFELRFTHNSTAIEGIR